MGVTIGSLNLSFSFIFSGIILPQIFLRPDLYDYNQANKFKQKQLSKEFFREWLMENDFQGQEGQNIPNISDQTVELISNRYIELYEKLMNKKFVKDSTMDVVERIKSNLSNFL